MRVLQICPRVPFPIKDGGVAAMWSVYKGLKKQNIETEIFALNTLKHFVLESTTKQIPDITSVTINTTVNIKAAFLNLFSNSSYNVNRFFSVDAEQKLVQLLKSKTFDIIQLESIYVTSYISIIKQHSKAKIILRSHNIEYILLKQQAKQQSNLFKKIYLNYLSEKLKKFEINTAFKYDGIAVISKPEYAFYTNLTPAKKVIHIPFGIEIPQKTENKITNKLKFYFVGALDWQPNLEAANWLINTIWKPHFANNPHIELHIAGKKTPQELKNIAEKNLFIHGEVENMEQFIYDKNIMLCPLFSGSGMRIKLVEALANSKPIIATKLAAEGINLEKENCGWFAENELEFVSKIKFCTTTSLDQFSDNAYTLAQKNFNQQKITSNLVKFYTSIL